MQPNGKGPHSGHLKGVILGMCGGNSDGDAKRGRIRVCPIITHR